MEPCRKGELIHLDHVGAKGSGIVSAAVGTVTVLGMDDEGVGRGAAIQARREGYGWHANALAKRADISRDTLAAVEADVSTVRPATFAKVERALDEIAEEIGDDGPAQQVGTEVTLRGVYGIDELIYKSPSQDPDLVAEAVSKLIEQLRPRD